MRDHPRMRGEHHFQRQQPQPAWGSPPHARGALAWRYRRGEARGITPACAGSTRPTCWPASRRDHPRMRGEHMSLSFALRFFVGSPPHARGARNEGGGGGMSAGITPACAGSTGARARAGRPSRDHPRMRGEHAGSQSFSSGDWGSPPHARGALQRGDCIPKAPGITPACAGSTLKNPCILL